MGVKFTVYGNLAGTVMAQAFNCYKNTFIRVHSIGSMERQYNQNTYNVNNMQNEKCALTIYSAIYVSQTWLHVPLLCIHGTILEYCFCILTVYWLVLVLRLGFGII